MREFSINFPGRVNNFQLSSTKPLIPLFEAIVNSINAIDERSQNEGKAVNGKITIRILRKGETTLPFSNSADDSQIDISGFEIVDNGCGFNEENLESFTESDSSHKMNIGGKGIGRFTWLKAFKKVEISSRFKEANKWKNRSFDFDISQKGILDHNEVLSRNISEKIDFETKVRLLDYRKEFLKYLPKGKNDSSKVMHQIIQHCIVYFLNVHCPSIHLIDGNTDYDLNKTFKEIYATDEKQATFQVEGEAFSILHVKIESKIYERELSNKFLLCANSRQVLSRKTEKLIPDLNRAFYDHYKFSYAGIIRGRYLDEFVNPARESFNIPENGSSDDEENSTLTNEITMKKILEAAAEEVKKYLHKELFEVATKKKERIKDYIIKKAPRYRAILRYVPEKLECIKGGLSENELDDALNKIKREFDHENEENLRKLVRDRIKGCITKNDYAQKEAELIERIAESNKSELAQYIIRRRITLDYFEHVLKLQSDDKFSKESEIHNLLYPMKTTSDRVPNEAHNLWLIDERLAYFSYIASDKPLDGKNGNRPDILMLGNPAAFTDEDTMDKISSVVIIELKRPMRDDYSETDNPIDQMIKYVRQIRNGRAKMDDGRNILADEQTRFYLYAICDITRTLAEILEGRDFRHTADGMGYYSYNQNLNSYIEVLPFNKVYIDAMKRNKILFRKLGFEK